MPKSLSRAVLALHSQGSKQNASALLNGPSACFAVGMYADASGAAQTFQYDTAALQQLGASIAPLAPQPVAVGTLLTCQQARGNSSTIASDRVIASEAVVVSVVPSSAL